MIVRFHKASARKIIYHRRDSGNRNGKIVRPGFNRRGNPRFLRICAGQARQLFQKFFQKRNVFERAPNPRPRPVCQRRELKIQVGNHASAPLRMHRKYLFIRARRPVELRIRHAPFLGRHTAEYQRIFGLISNFQQRFSHRKHHRNCGIIVLKTVKIGIVMCGKHNSALRVRFSGNLPDDVIGRLCRDHLCRSVKQHLYLTAALQHFFQLICIVPGNRKCRCIRRSRDILCVQCAFVYLSVAARLCGNDSCRAF